MADQTQPSAQVKREGTNWRGWALGIAVLLLAIIVAQNSQDVDVDILFINTTAPLIVILLITAVLGAIIGYVFPVVRRHRRDERRRSESKD
jgi:uncharacterized integral membrane protein